MPLQEMWSITGAASDVVTGIAEDEDDNDGNGTITVTQFAGPRTLAKICSSKA